MITVTDPGGGPPLPEDFTTWLDAAAAGDLDLGALITTVAPFTDDALAEAFRAMLAGEVIRTVIAFDR
jgi:Zn-dependent alcohol dehydrogenase